MTSFPSVLRRTSLDASTNSTNPNGILLVGDGTIRCGKTTQYDWHGGIRFEVIDHHVEALHVGMILLIVDDDSLLVAFPDY
jgi:hypothetical protein